MFEPPRILVDPLLGCHIWQGATTRNGHPVMRLNGRVQQVRRVVYERERRALDPRERVTMACGHKRCVLAQHAIARMPLRS